jgi:PadR family transcriptional regulator, regulatory protein PadR
MSTRPDTLQGSLPLLVLTILSRRGPLHGYAITSHIHDLSDVLRIEEGSLYPALHRMEEAGWIRARTITTAHNRRARAYEITAAGRRQREAAEAVAQRQFGNRLRLRESSRDVKLLPWLDGLARNVHHGLRALRRTPVFASAAIITLALGVGANAAVFSVVNATLIQPLPYSSREGHRIDPLVTLRTE